MPSKYDHPDTKVNSSMRLGDVIHEMANLGATYPELVQILEGASKQKNLAGALVVDAVPAASPKYEDALLGYDSKKDDKLTKAGAESRGRTSLMDRLLGRDKSKAGDAPAAKAPAKPSPLDPAMPELPSRTFAPKL